MYYWSAPQASLNFLVRNEQDILELNYAKQATLVSHYENLLFRNQKLVIDSC